MTEKIQSTIKKRTTFLVIKCFKTKGNVRVAKKSCRFFHNATQGIKVKCIQSTRSWKSHFLQLSQSSHMMIERCIFGGAESISLFIIRAMQEVTFVSYRGFLLFCTANLIAHYIEKK